MDGLPRPRFGRTGMDWLDHGQVLALAGVIARELAASPDQTTASLASTVEAQREILAHYPDLDAIEACYRAGPEDGCAFCGPGSTPFPGHEVQEVPDWVHQAKAERDAAVLTLSAIAEAGDTLALSDGQSLGQWLAGLYRSDRSKFFETFQVLRNDSSPQSQQAIAEAHSLIFGDQPPAAPAGPTPLPGGMMSHTLAAGRPQRQHTLGHQRQHLELEGNRSRRAPGDTISGDRHQPPEPPPPAPESPEPPEDQPRRRRRRLR